MARPNSRNCQKDMGNARNGRIVKGVKTPLVFREKHVQHPDQ